MFPGKIWRMMQESV